MQSTNHYSDLFLNDIPMMDVRAPIEFGKGAFPTAINLPLMNDDEREMVGTCYKEKGQEAAVALGHSLVKGAVKEARVAQWQQFAQNNPKGLLYCFRGGMRSRITQQWLADAAIDMPYVDGGYKAMRGYLLEHLHQRISEGNIFVLSGATGSGKTEVIKQWPNSVDLEGLANHRGSAFGSMGTHQPAQISFENSWSIEWLKRHHKYSGPVMFEDESRLIGRIAVLPEFLALAKQAPIILLKAPLEQRIARIRQDYFIDAYTRQLPNGEPEALAYLDNFIRSALTRIKKRLGGVRFAALTSILDIAIQTLADQNRWGPFDDIIECLLSDYYDPMYQYQYQSKAPKQIFEGTHEEILQWLAHNQTE